MKALLCLISLFAVVLFDLDSAPVEAQTIQPRGGTSSDQWASHQMNQPPPSQDRHPVSQDRLDEIRQLYLQAKQEAEKKTSVKDNGQK
jgi:hypothetical protein